MADYTASLKDDPDVAPRKREEVPSLIPLYIISFVILTGAVIAFIEVGNSLSAKQGTINTLQQSLDTLQASFNTANTTLSNQINNTVSQVNTLNSTLNHNIANITSTLNADISKVNTTVSTLQTDYNTLNVNVQNIIGNVSTLNLNVSTLNSDILSINSNVASLNSTINGLSTPTAFNFNSVFNVPANINVTKKVTTGINYASGSNNLTVTQAGYLACSTAFAYTPSFNNSVDVYLGYVIGNLTFSSIYTSTVSNNTANFAFATVNIPVNASNNGNSVSFQVAFSGNATTIAVTPLSSSAFCSLFS